MQSAQIQRETKAQIEQLEANVQGFSGKEIYQRLSELNATNPQLASALDNPQGWQMLHTLIQVEKQNTQNTQITQQNNTIAQPDVILSGAQNSSAQGNAQEIMDKLRNGNATYADMGRIFG